MMAVVATLATLSPVVMLLTVLTVVTVVIVVIVAIVVTLATVASSAIYAAHALDSDLDLCNSTRITTNVFCYFPVNEFNLSILEAIERETNVPFLKSVSDITQGSGFRKGAIRNH